MTAAIHLLRPLPVRVRVATVSTDEAMAQARKREAEEHMAMVAHAFLAGRARRLMPNCTEAEREELARLIAAGPRHGLRDAVLHLELAGVVPVQESLCA